MIGDDVTTFLTFGVVVMLMPLGVMGLLWALTTPVHPDLKRLVAGALWLFVGLILPWAGYQLAIGHGFLDIWRVSMSYHLGLDRDYWTWLGYHLYDFSLFLGVPLSGLFLLGLSGAVRHPKTGRRTFTLAWGLSLLILVFSGVSRGEVARVWLFLTPFPVIAASGFLAASRSSYWRCVGLAVLLAGQLVVFNAFLRVVTTGVTDPPSRQRHFDIPPVANTVEARFTDRITLLGYDIHPMPVEPGATLTLTLTWQAEAPIAHSYTVFNHLITPAGDMLAQQDGLPQEGRAPTTCWAPGEVVTDTYSLAMPAEVDVNRAHLLTGLYRWETGERLPAEGPTVTQNEAVQLGEIKIHP